MVWTNLRWSSCTNKVRLLLGNRRDVLPALSTRLTYTGFWLLVFALKVVLEYVMVLRPLVAPTRALWHWGDGDLGGGPGAPEDLYCWGYNMLFGDCNLDGHDVDA